MIGVGLIARIAIFSEGEPEELIMQKMEQTSLTRIAPIVDMEVETLMKRLGHDGYTVDTPEMSIEALAEAHGAETDDVLLSVFRGVASLGTSEMVVSLKETVTVDLPKIEFDIHLADGEGVAGYRLTIAYDPFVLDYVATTDGDYLPTGGLFLRPALGADEIYALHLTVGDTTTTGPSVVFGEGEAAETYSLSDFLFLTPSDPAEIGQPWVIDLSVEETDPIYQAVSVLRSAPQAADGDGRLAAMSFDVLNPDTPIHIEFVSVALFDADGTALPATRANDSAIIRHQKTAE